MKRQNPVICFDTNGSKQLIVMDKITHVTTESVECESQIIKYRICIYVIGREHPIVVQFEKDDIINFNTTFDLIRLAIDHNQSYNDDKLETPEFMKEEIKKYLFDQNH